MYRLSFELNDVLNLSAAIRLFRIGKLLFISGIGHILYGHLVCHR